MFSYGVVSLKKMDSQYIDGVREKDKLFSSNDVDAYFEHLDVKVTEKRKIQEIFEQSVQNAYLQGVIKADENGNVFPDMLYPFYSRHILAIYTHKKTGERGIWFHLIDGSIWNSDGHKEPAITVKDFISC